jgi:hypothetical protein
MVAEATAGEVVEGFTAEVVALVAVDPMVVAVPAVAVTTAEGFPAVRGAAADIVAARMEVCAEGLVRAQVHRDPGLRIVTPVRGMRRLDFIPLMARVAALGWLEDDLSTLGDRAARL